MKRNASHITLLISIFFASGVHAQSVAKLDLMKLLEEVPTSPATVSEAHDKAVCTANGCRADELFKNFEADWKSANEQWKVMNAGTAHTVDSAKQIANMMKPAIGKSKTEQLEYAKHMPGANTQALSFAQQMQDPAFKKKFQAMSPQEKLAYVQGHGVGGAPSNSVIDQDSGLSKTKQDFTNRMISDPAFAAQWKRMTPAEQNAYMKQQADKNGTDWKAIAARSRAKNPAAQRSDTTTSSNTNDDSGGGLLSDDSSPSSANAASPAAGLAQQANTATSRLLGFHPSILPLIPSIDSIIRADNQRMQQALNKHEDELKALAKSKGIGSIVDPPGVHKIREAEMEHEIADVNTALANLQSAWNQDKAQITGIVSGYNTNLIQSNYCADFTSPAEQSMITGIAQAQMQAAGIMDEVEQAMKKVYPATAYVEVEKQKIDSEKVGKYQEFKNPGEGD